MKRILNKWQLVLQLCTLVIMATALGTALVSALADEVVPITASDLTPESYGSFSLYVDTCLVWDDEDNEQLRPSEGPVLRVVECAGSDAWDGIFQVGPDGGHYKVPSIEGLGRLHYDETQGVEVGYIFHHCTNLMGSVDYNTWDDINASLRLNYGEKTYVDFPVSLEVVENPRGYRITEVKEDPGNVGSMYGYTYDTRNFTITCVLAPTVVYTDGVLDEELFEDQYIDTTTSGDYLALHDTTPEFSYYEGVYEIDLYGNKVPYRSGYTFVGWRLISGVNPEAYKCGDVQETIEADQMDLGSIITYEAVWIEGRPVSYDWGDTLSRDGYNLNPPGVARYLAGEIVNPDNLYIAGTQFQRGDYIYTFSGWDHTEQFTMGSEAVVIRGSWIKTPVSHTTPTDFVTLTIQYVDNKNVVVRTDTLVVAKDTSYDVTDRIVVPHGYELADEPDNTTGVADSDKFILVPLTKQDVLTGFTVIGIQYVDQKDTVVRMDMVYALKGLEYDVTNRITAPSGYTLGCNPEEVSGVTGTADMDKTLTVPVIRTADSPPDLSVEWVSVTIKYIDTADVVVSSDTFEVVKDSDYDVTERIKIPTGYVANGVVENTEGAANKDVVVVVPIKKVVTDTPSTTPSTPAWRPPVVTTPTITKPTVPTIANPALPANGLNITDHYAYIVGFPDGTVGPERDISRGEVATIFYRLMGSSYRNRYWADTNQFPDVNSETWCNVAVSTCANAGLIYGYPDGTFRQADTITRSEFIAIAARFLTSGDTEGYEYFVDYFSDMSSHWSRVALAKVVIAGWVPSNISAKGGKFNPNAPITRAEVITVINRMTNRLPDKDNQLRGEVHWPDNPRNAWYYAEIQEASNGHQYTKNASKTGETWTRLTIKRNW